MCRLDEVDMDIVVYNNLTAEAIEASGQTLEEMLEAQARLLRRLTDPSRQRAIINLDGAPPDALKTPQKPVNFRALPDRLIAEISEGSPAMTWR